MSKTTRALDHAATDLLSTGQRQQRWADLRETTLQGRRFDDTAQPEDSVYIDTSLHLLDPLDILIHQEDAAAEPTLPRIGGLLGSILALADAGKDEEQIGATIGLGKKRIQQILAAPTLRAQIEFALRQPELPFL